jgi:hypothetical protein
VPQVPWLTALVLVSAWSIAPPYLGPALGLDLDVSDSVEVVDHVVPGVVAALAAGLALTLARSGEADSGRALGALAACALAGLWETASHAPLVFDAGDPERPWHAVIFHAWPGPVMLALALFLLLAPPAREPLT